MTDAAVAVAGAWTTDPSRLPDELSSTFRAVMGWGGVAVWDESVDIVDLTREFAARTVQECCGQCFPCRIGMHEVADILEEICEGKGTEARLARALELSRHVAEASRCDLGRTGGYAVLESLEQHYDAFAAAVAARQPMPARRVRRHRGRAVHGRLPRRRRHPGLRGAAAHRRGRALGRGRAPALPHAGDHRPRVRASLRGRLPPRLGGRARRHPHAQALRRRQRGRASPPVRCPGKPRVAIIGAGPAGLACAYYLGLEGVIEHHLRGAARGRRHGRRRHPRLPPAARGAARRGRACRVPRRQDRLQLPLRRRRHHGAALRAGLRGRVRRRRRPPVGAHGLRGRGRRLRRLHARRRVPARDRLRQDAAHRQDDAGHRRRQRGHGLRPLRPPHRLRRRQAALPPHRGRDAGRPGRDRRGQGRGRRDGHPGRADEDRGRGRQGHRPRVPAHAAGRARLVRPPPPRAGRGLRVRHPLRLHRPGHRPGLRRGPARAQPHRGQQVEDPRGRPAHHAVRRPARVRRRRLLHGAEQPRRGPRRRPPRRGVHRRVPAGQAGRAAAGGPARARHARGHPQRGADADPVHAAAPRSCVPWSCRRRSASSASTRSKAR